MSRYQKGKTNLDFTEVRGCEWQRHQLGRMQVCTSLQTDNHASTPPLSFLQAGCPSCRPTNSVKALLQRKYRYNALAVGPTNSSKTVKRLHGMYGFLHRPLYTTIKWLVTISGYRLRKKSLSGLWYDRSSIPDSTEATGSDGQSFPGDRQIVL